MHILCTICSDLVNQAESIYVTKCGHIFHHHCLAQWIERSKSCPQCRNKVTDKCMFRLYPTISNDITSGEDVATLQSRLDDAQLQLRQQKTICKDREDKLYAIQMDLKKNEEILKAYEKKLVSRESAVNGLREQVEYLKMQNKETTRLKEENETLQQNMQLLNGLNNILNATCEDVEKMLQGYTDVRTVAVFATALKRGLCESEAKKREIRDKLHAAKQQIATEKNTVADLQAKLLQMEDKLSDMERKYKTVAKRKAGDMADGDQDSTHTESAAKQQRSLDLFELSGPMLTVDKDDSIGMLVNKIESADSPYLSLKQSSLALSALQRNPKHTISMDKIKPSELAIINAARNTFMKSGMENVPSNSQKSVSIFSKREPLKLDSSEDLKLTQPNICYDGLGGHSKLEIFPVPNNKPVKNLIPKLTAKHRLKRPTPAGNQNICKMIEKMMDK